MERAGVRGFLEPSLLDAEEDRVVEAEQAPVLDEAALVRPSRMRTTRGRLTPIRAEPIANTRRWRYNFVPTGSREVGYVACAHGVAGNGLGGDSPLL